MVCKGHVTVFMLLLLCKFDSLYSDNNKDSSFEKIVSVMLSHIYTFQNSNSSNVLYILQTSIADINTYVSWRGKG